MEELLALGLTVGVHILGALALVWLLLRSSHVDAHDWWSGDDDGGRAPDPPPPTRPPPGGGGLPLPDAEPSSVRLRAPGQIAEGYPRPPRRPAHPPLTPERRPEYR